MSNFDLQAALAGILGDDNEQPAVGLGGLGDGCTGTVEPAVDDVPLMTAPADVTKVVTNAIPLPDGALSGLELESVNAIQLTKFPVFTDETIAATLDIRNYATQVRLKVRKYVARKADKKAAKSNERDAGSVDGAYTAYKKLFAGCEDKLKAVNSVLDSARTRHYSMTLPWSTTGMEDSGRRDGPRLLANTLFMEYITEMAHAKAAVKDRLRELEQAYPDLLTEARKNLGKAFVITDYPTPDQLKNYFELEFDFYPIPAGTDFKGLPAQQCTALSDKLNEAKRLCMENAMKDVWKRTFDVVQAMHLRLKDTKAVFHDTLVENVREMAEFLKHFNATKDTYVVTLQKKIEADLCRYDADALRGDLTKRALTARLAQDILEEMDNRGA